jgi:hypothetical protein
VPTFDIARLVRGNDLPARLNAHETRPEQSKAFGPLAPYRYGEPILLIAKSRAAARVAAATASAAAGWGSDGAVATTGVPVYATGSGAASAAGSTARTEAAAAAVVTTAARTARAGRWLGTGWSSG